MPLSGTQLWRAALSRREKNKRAWCARCMAHFERCWNICAKPARGRVHPVPVVTVSSRVSRNSRAGWPTVHHQQAPPCVGLPTVHYLSITVHSSRLEKRCVSGARHAPSSPAWTQAPSWLPCRRSREVAPLRRRRALPRTRLSSRRTHLLGPSLRPGLGPAPGRLQLQHPRSSHQE